MNKILKPVMIINTVIGLIGLTVLIVMQLKAEPTFNLDYDVSDFVDQCNSLQAISITESEPVEIKRVKEFDKIVVQKCMLMIKHAAELQVKNSNKYNKESKKIVGQLKTEMDTYIKEHGDDGYIITAYPKSIVERSDALCKGATLYDCLDMLANKSHGMNENWPGDLTKYWLYDFHRIHYIDVPLIKRSTTHLNGERLH